MASSHTYAVGVGPPCLHLVEQQQQLPIDKHHRMLLRFGHAGDIRRQFAKRTDRSVSLNQAFLPTLTYMKCCDNYPHSTWPEQHHCLRKGCWWTPGILDRQFQCNPHFELWALLVGSKVGKHPPYTNAAQTKGRLMRSNRNRLPLHWPLCLWLRKLNQANR